MIYGYARVSTNAQDLASQLDQLTAAGAVKVFQEKASGAKRDRAALARAIKHLEAGDVLTITRLDRLALQLQESEALKIGCFHAIRIKLYRLDSCSSARSKQHTPNYLWLCVWKHNCSASITVVF